jgi:hypothetical protein
MYLPPSRPCCHGRSLNRPWLKRRRSLSRKNLIISRCSPSDTVACVSSRPSCSRILNSIPRRPQPSCCRLSICSATSMPAASARCPRHVPTGFVKPRWRPHVYASGGVDRHFYELCALAELRDRLRAGDIWVTGSRQYRDFETYLIPAATLARRNRSATGDASQGLNFPAGTWPAETQALNEAATCSW